MPWQSRFPDLDALTPDQRGLLARHAVVARVPAGTVVFGPGDPADNLLLLVEGTVRVQHLSEGGRLIVLYRVQAGESCVLTTACLMAQDAYTAEGVAETDAQAVMIPRDTFDALVGGAPAFRRLVFDAYARRISDLFLLIDEVVFQRIDTRLAGKLVELSGGSGTVQVTHQQLADELGTAREVISRQLQEFQRRGWITLARGVIGLSDLAALRGSARG